MNSEQFFRIVFAHLSIAAWPRMIFEHEFRYIPNGKQHEVAAGLCDFFTALGRMNIHRYSGECPLLSPVSVSFLNVI